MAIVEEGVSSAEHLFPIHVPGEIRDSAIAALNRKGISVAVNYRSVPTLSYYRDTYGYQPNDFPVSYGWGCGTITLPLYPTLRRDEQEAIVEAVITDVLPLCG
jgi:UDP-4-amino-4-deoxy-L-arabinose-oxoglutarate aminotransferase